MKDNDLKEIQGHLIAKIRCCSAGNKVLTVPVAEIFPLFSSFFLIVLFLCVRVWVSCSTLCDPMDCTRLGSSVHGISEARILEWVAIPFSKPSAYSTLILQPSLLYSPPKNTHYGIDSEKREPCTPHKVYFRKQVCHFALVNSTTPHTSCVQVGMCLYLWVQITICTSWSQG